jgi:hypothetical protein
MKAKYNSARCLLHACFLLGLFFESKDEGDMFPEMLLKFQGTELHCIPDYSTLQCKRMLVIKKSRLFF